MRLENELSEMLLRDCKKMREAGQTLAIAAMYVVKEHDGTHRLSLAIAEWNKVIANEGDRDIYDHSHTTL